MQTPNQLPFWLKLAFTVFMLVWTPLVVATQGWQNFLWLCDVANFLVLAGLWLESRLLLSSQLVATLLIGLAWTVDLLTAFYSGFHPFGATGYMFDGALPLALRLSSLFHIAVPILLLFAVGRLGHDRRGWRLATLICWIVLPLTAWLTDPERNINLIERRSGFNRPGCRTGCTCWCAWLPTRSSSICPPRPRCGVSWAPRPGAGRATPPSILDTSRRFDDRAVVAARSNVRTCIP